MSKHTIRKLWREDIPSLLLLCRDHAAYENAVYRIADQERDLERGIFGSDPRLFCWVAEGEPGDLIGYCSYMFEYSTWQAADFIHMDCLYLKSEARNQGLGRLLMQKMVEHANAAEIGEIQWQTPESNHDAIRFYRKTGALPKAKVRFFLRPQDFLPD